MQTPVDSCAELELQSLGNIELVQLLVQKMGQVAVVLAGIVNDMSSGIQYSPKHDGDGLGQPSDS